MESLSNVGALAFTFSLIYLGYHLVKKKRNKQRKLSKKIFFPFFIGGLLTIGIASPFIDNGLQAQLDEALAENDKLDAEIKELKTELKGLQSRNEELTKTNEELTTKDAYAEESQSENESLNKKITELEGKNKTLEDEVNSLKDQLATKETTVAANTSTSNNSTSSSSGQSAAASSGKSENFANCTELRKVYPNGVDSNHPAYQSKMDRDKDNYACER